MFRRNRAAATAPPDPALLTLVDTTGAAARRSRDLTAAIGVVLRDVADTAGWSAGHAWAPGAEPGTWTSLRLWHPDDGIALGVLRRACFESAPGPARGHLAHALHLQGPRWTADLGALAGTPVHEAARSVGVVAAIGCPVYAYGTPVALLEWYLADARPPGAEVPYVLAHLAGVLGEVAARPVVHGVPEQGTMRVGTSRGGVVAGLLRR